jgi:DNA-binding response OmpR family regulator
MSDGKMTILVVDDEEQVRKLLQRILEDAGYGVVTVANGLQALDKLTQGNINLVLLDMRMPELDGFATLKLIREQSGIPVIMLTGIGEVTTKIDVLNLGADDYVKKPFSQGELLARIKTKLRRVKK